MEAYKIDLIAIAMDTMAAHPMGALYIGTIAIALACFALRDWA
jgi:hypothetical protein